MEAAPGTGSPGGVRLHLYLEPLLLGSRVPSRPARYSLDSLTLGDLQGNQPTMAGAFPRRRHLPAQGNCRDSAQPSNLTGHVTSGGDVQAGGHARVTVMRTTTAS